LLKLKPAAGLICESHHPYHGLAFSVSTIGHGSQMLCTFWQIFLLIIELRFYRFLSFRDDWIWCNLLGLSAASDVRIEPMFRRSSRSSSSGSDVSMWFRSHVYIPCLWAGGRGWFSTSPQTRWLRRTHRHIRPWWWWPKWSSKR
jgi:hypothetical protein